MCRLPRCGAVAPIRSECRAHERQGCATNLQGPRISLVAGRCIVFHPASLRFCAKRTCTLCFGAELIFWPRRSIGSLPRSLCRAVYDHALNLPRPMRGLLQLPWPTRSTSLYDVDAPPLAKWMHMHWQFPHKPTSKPTLKPKTHKPTSKPITEITNHRCINPHITNCRSSQTNKHTNKPLNQITLKPRNKPDR
jgi:hypothetical protein